MMYDILKKMQSILSSESEVNAPKETKTNLSESTIAMESKFKKFLEAEDKKAEKDYDGDGKIESEKDEVWGSRLKAAGKKLEDVSEGTIWDDDYEEDNEDESQDEGFFIAIENNDGSGFVGAIVKDGSKWVENKIAGKAPHNWGSRYMGYLKPADVMHWIRNDYKGVEIHGPFDSEDEAMEYVGLSESGLNELSTKKYKEVAKRAEIGKFRADQEYGDAELDDDEPRMADSQRRYNKHRKAEQYAKTKVGVAEAKWSSPFKKGQKVLLLKQGIIAIVTKINPNSLSIDIKTQDGKVAHIFDYQFNQIKAYNGPVLSQSVTTEIVELLKNGTSPEEVSKVIKVPVDVVTEFVPTQDIAEETLNEKSKSKSQQRFFGMVRAAQKGEKPASKEVAKVAKGMGKKDVKDFAKTKHKGLPKHVTESRNYVSEAHSTFDHLLQRFPAELKQFERTHQLDNDLYDALYDYYRSSGEMPYGVAKARSGDPMEWIADKLSRDLGIGHQDSLPFDDDFSELDEIAKLAGIQGQEPLVDDALGIKTDSISPVGHTELDEWEAPSREDDWGHHDYEKQSHDPTFYTDEEELAHWYGNDVPEWHDDEQEMDEGNEFSGALAAAKASGQKEFEVGGKKYTVKEDVNLNISANGEEDALNLIRKLSGLPEKEHTCSCQAGTDDNLIDIIPDTDGIEVEEIPVDEERDIEYINTPREKVAPISAVYPSGTDLHKAKQSYSDKPFRGDNPMADRRVEESLWKKYSDLLKGITK